MKANLNCVLNGRGLIHKVGANLLLLLLMMGLPGAWAQTITSDPADGAANVSVSAAVTFTFSAAVDPTMTTATFYSTSPPGAYPVTSAWSAGNTVLTCTPVSPFPNNATISWTVLVNVTPIPVFAQGSFTTGAGGGGGGSSGTNAITTYAVGKLYLYEQTNSSSPVLSSNSFGFTANTSVISNETSTAVTVTIPGATTPTSLQKNPVAADDYYFIDFFIPSQTTFESTYPQGNYAFKVTGTPANLQGTVNMPTTMVQPNAPHISNYAAAQSVNASQAFTVTWDAFQGGTTSDFITLSVGNGLFATPNPGTNGALNGTATSVSIPPGKLEANTNYVADLVFYHYVATSNATYATVGFRATGTEFKINTVGSASVVPVVSNPVSTGGTFGFDVTTTPDQVLTLWYSTNCFLPMSQWQKISTTNSSGGTSVHFDVSAQASGNGFFRVGN